MTENQAAAAYHAMADEFSLVIRLVRELQSHYLKRRHWDAIEDILGFSVSPIVAQQTDSTSSINPSHLSVTLGALVETHSIKVLPAIQAITLRAAKEASICDLLEIIRTTWEAASFELVVNGGRNKVPILMRLPRLANHVEHDVVAVARLLQSPYVGYIRDEVEDWRATLARLANQLDGLSRFQRHYIQLAALFRGSDTSNVTRTTPSDMSNMLPSAERILSDSETWWRDLMNNFAADSRVLQAMALPAITHIDTYTSGLCTALNEIHMHLEDRRRGFPRLHLCADLDLFGAIARTSPGNVICMILPAIRSCFPVISNVEFGTKAVKDVVIIALDGDSLAIQFDFKIRSSFEEWLHAFDLATRRAIVKGCRPAMRAALAFEDTGLVAGYSNDRMPISEASCHRINPDTSLEVNRDEVQPDDFLLTAQPIQCVVVTMQILWCESIVTALTRTPTEVDRALVEVIAKRELQHTSIAAAIQSRMSEKKCLKLSALFIVALQALESARHLVTLRVDSIEDFNWLATLRLELRSTSTPSSRLESVSAMEISEERQDVVVCLGSIPPIQYGFEYVGCAHTRILVTPATERCWLSLAMIFQRGLGAHIWGSRAGWCMASTAECLAATAGEMFLSVDCTVTMMTIGQDRQDGSPLPFMCSRLLKCVGLAAHTWACFVGVNAMTCDALTCFLSSVNKILSEARSMFRGFCAAAVSNTAVLASSVSVSWPQAFWLGPRIVVTSHKSDLSLSDTSRMSDLHRCFRPLLCTLPDAIQIVMLQLNLAGFGSNESELLCRRIMGFWNLFHGLAFIAKVRIGTPRELNRVLRDTLNDLPKQVRIDKREDAVAPPNAENVPGEESDRHVDFASAFRKHILRAHQKSLDIRTVDLLLEGTFLISRESFSGIYPVEARHDDPDLVSKAILWAPPGWKLRPHSRLVVDARYLCDTVCSGAARITALVGAPGSGKTSIAFAAAALAAASSRSMQGAEYSTQAQLSVVTANALPLEDLWGSQNADGKWSDGAGSAMIRAAAVITRAHNSTPLSEEVKSSGFIGGARWVLFDFDGNNPELSLRRTSSI